MKKEARLKVAYFLIVVGIVALATILYFQFVEGEFCQEFRCFERHMEKCSKAKFINEESEASWLYDVQGLRGGECIVNVKLLQVKKGSFEAQELEGFEMSCFYEKGITAYPEKNLDLCHGRLKEELQGVVIKKLHTHILENLGDIDEELNTGI